jgi:integrase
MTRLFLAEAKRSSMCPALFLLKVTSGLRIGEILDLEWSQVNFLLGEVSVGQGKTQAAIRTIPVPEQVIEAIKALPRVEERIFP